LTETEVIDRLRTLLDDKTNQTSLAMMIGVTPQFITSVLRGRRPPSQKVLNLLGLERVVLYREKPNDQD